MSGAARTLIADHDRAGGRGVRLSLDAHGFEVELTKRERQVLELLERGLRTVEIGTVLAISAATVRRDICEILRKLEVPDRQSALRLLSESDD